MVWHEERAQQKKALILIAILAALLGASCGQAVRREHLLRRRITCRQARAPAGTGGCRAGYGTAGAVPAPEAAGQPDECSLSLCSVEGVHALGGRSPQPASASPAGLQGLQVSPEASLRHSSCGRGVRPAAEPQPSRGPHGNSSSGGSWHRPAAQPGAHAQPQPGAGV